MNGLIRSHSVWQPTEARGECIAISRTPNLYSPAALNLSASTVDAHHGKIMEKLNLHSTSEQVRLPCATA